MVCKQQPENNSHLLDKFRKKKKIKVPKIEAETAES